MIMSTVVDFHDCLERNSYEAQAWGEETGEDGFDWLGPDDVVVVTVWDESGAIVYEGRVRTAELDGTFSFLIAAIDGGLL